MKPAPCVCVSVSYQECIRAVPTDDPDADRLMLRFRTVTADVNWSQVDDPFTGRKKTLRKGDDFKYLKAGGACT